MLEAPTHRAVREQMRSYASSSKERSFLSAFLGFLLGFEDLDFPLLSSSFPSPMALRFLLALTGAEPEEKDRPVAWGFDVDAEDVFVSLDEEGASFPSPSVSERGGRPFAISNVNPFIIKTNPLHHE